jgi:hypothetical protein
MNTEEAYDMVGDPREVIAYGGLGAEFARGHVIAYSIVPTLTIERADGTRFSWRHEHGGGGR